MSQISTNHKPLRLGMKLEVTQSDTYWYVRADGTRYLVLTINKASRKLSVRSCTCIYVTESARYATRLSISQWLYAAHLPPENYD